MSDDLKDILSNLNPDVDQEALLRYLQGKLSAGEQHELEKQMMDDEFGADALEGLQNFKDKRDISLLVEQLNSDLEKKTEKKKKFKEKLRLQLDPIILFTIILILLLIVISYIVISHAHHTTGH
ncbi:MAG: hypothetical protein ACJ749_15665 [Flavisolibacter sp.]